MFNKRGFGKTIVIILLVALVIAIVSVIVFRNDDIQLSPLASGSGSICYDSDNGITYNVKGTVFLSSSRYSNKTDYCFSNSINLIEFYCNGNSIASKNYTCPNGCSNGACKQNSTNQTRVNGVCGSALDSCIAGTFQDTNDTSTNYLWNCLGINGGSNANCNLVRPTLNQTCTDSDGGVNIYVKGYIYGINLTNYYTLNDSCYDSNTVIEKSCLDNYAYENWITCPNGCMAGACKQNSTNQTGFDYSLSVPSVTVTQGSTASQTMTITKLSGNSQAVNVTVGSLPAGVTLTSGKSQLCNPTSGSCSVTFSYSALGSTPASVSLVSVTGKSSGVADKVRNFTFTVNAQSLPSTPVGLIGMFSSTSQVTLSWAYGANPTGGFEIFISNGTNDVSQGVVGPSARSFSLNVGGLTNSHYYYVVAYSSTNVKSGKSNYVTRGPPQTPSPFSFTDYVDFAYCGTYASSKATWSWSNSFTNSRSNQDQYIMSCTPDSQFDFCSTETFPFDRTNKIYCHSISPSAFWRTNCIKARNVFGDSPEQCVHIYV